MAICVIQDASGAIKADPSPVDQCPGYVLVTPGEHFANQDGGFLPPLTTAQGVALSVAILSVWAVAAGIRHLIDVVRGS